LEVVRAVVDGSTDKRDEDCYAETPDRMVLLMMVSIGASVGEVAMTGDAVRAYLNATSLDRNLVVIASRYMMDIPRVGLLNKGLYGTLKGALGWERWVEEKICREGGFRKCDVPRSVYTMERGGDVVRLFRHSDDFRMSGKDKVTVEEVGSELSGRVRMGGWEECSRFLGLTFEYIKKGHRFEEGGNIVLVRGVEKIEEMEGSFGYLAGIYNRKGRVREVPLPLDVIKGDDELDGEFGVSLDREGVKLYMSIVGIAIMILKFDVRFAYLVLSRRLSRPREWEMFLAVWVM